MPSTKPRITIRTEKEIIEKFKNEAEKEEKSMSEKGEELIKEYLKNQMGGGASK